MVWRSVTNIVDDNTLEYQMFLIPKGGKEEKMMEMTMNRNGNGPAGTREHEGDGESRASAPGLL